MDKRILLVSGLILLAELGYLLRDVNVFGTSDYFSNKKGAFAQLVEKQNQVQTRNGQRLYWSDAIKEQQLFNHDSLMTSDHSTATVKFNSGSALDVDENTLVTLEEPAQKEAPIKIAIGKGSTKVHFARAGKIDFGDGEIEGDSSSEIAVKTMGNGRYQVKLLKGNGKVHNKHNQHDIALSQADEVFEFNSAVDTPPPPQQTSELRWISPADGARFYTESSKATVPLEWTGNPKELVVRRVDSKKEQVIPINGQEKNTLQELPSGQYVVQLRDGTQIRSRQLMVVHAKPIQLVRPAAGETLPVRPNQKFSWTSGNAFKYKMEVAEDHDFSKVVKTLDSRTTAQAVENLPPGTYHWRVSGVDARGNAVPPSKQRKFTISDKKKLIWASKPQSREVASTEPPPSQDEVLPPVDGPSREKTLITKEEGPGFWERLRKRFSLSLYTISNFSSYKFSAPSSTGALSETTTPGIGLGLGALTEFNVSRKFEIESGILYYQRSYNVNVTLSSLSSSHPDKFSVISFPLMFKYWLSPRWNVGLGGYYLTATSGTINQGGLGSNAISDADIGSDDYGAAASASYNFFWQKFRWVVEARYNYGLKNVSLITDGKQTYSDIQALFGIRFDPAQ